MQDWYAFKDPRQFYYGAYVQHRARLQDSAESNYAFFEKRGLAANISAEVKRKIITCFLPFRYVEQTANLHMMSGSAYGYGTVITQACIFAAMDRLGMAQYISRIGLLLDGNTGESLQQAKDVWMHDPAWQPLRRFLEDSFVVMDPVELFVLQNVVLDGLLYPLVYETIIDDVLSAKGGTSVAMLTQFMTDWFAETKKWADATVKTAAAESDENKAILTKWITEWRDRAAAALLPVARIALGDRTDELVGEVVQQFNARMAKAGVAL